MNQFAGIYRFFKKDFNTQQLISVTVNCVVIQETEKSYKIKILTPVLNKNAGDTLWILKKNLIRRSWRVFGTQYCSKYNMEVAEQSCRACIQNCLTKERLQSKL